MSNLTKNCSIFLCGIGAFCILYFLLMTLIYGPFKISFSVMFLLMGIIFYSYGYIQLHYQINILNKFPYLLQKLVLILVVLGITNFLWVEANIIYYGTFQTKDPLDYVIVLGAGLNKDEPSTVLRMRLNEAIEYYNDVNPNTTFIVTGGQGDNETITEAEAMSKYLIERGIPSSQIIQENKASNTNQNFAYSNEFIKNTSTKTGVITNSFHMYRALHIAQINGIDPVAISAPSEFFTLLCFSVREYFGMWKFWLFHC